MSKRLKDLKNLKKNTESYVDVYCLLLRLDSIAFNGEARLVCKKAKNTFDRWYTTFKQYVTLHCGPTPAESSYGEGTFYLNTSRIIDGEELMILKGANRYTTPDVKIVSKKKIFLHMFYDVSVNFVNQHSYGNGNNVFFKIEYKTKKNKHYFTIRCYTSLDSFNKGQ